AAFMNASGGMLLIGVSDDHGVVGLENDYKLLSKKDRDGFGLWMTDLLRKCLGDAVAASVSVRFGRVDHHDVCLVNAPPHAAGPVFVYPGKERPAEFWLRMNNSTRHLDVEDALEYIHSHPRWSTLG
ncbi:MAG: ATP-binding protein, partial [Actinobacteria bacterium]